MQDNHPLPPWSDAAITFLSVNHPKFKFGFAYHKADQIVSACPFKCKGGHDRLVTFENGNIWCRQCGTTVSWRREPAQERQERVEKERADKYTSRLQMATCKDWMTYYDAVGAGASLWKQHGITNEDIEKWGLGFCQQAPCVDYPSSSLTIPIFYNSKLLDIRHRLITPRGDDKYRSHLPNLPPAYFNFDGVKGCERVFVVEGEKKAIVCNHNGLPTVAFPGLQFIRFLEDIIPRTVDQCQEIVFLPDPQSYATIKPTLEVLRSKGYSVKVIDLIDKPDDFILKFGVQLIKDSVFTARWY